MSNQSRSAIATAASVLILVAYCVALHYLISTRTMPRAALALALAPWGVALISLCARRKRSDKSCWMLAVVAIVGGLVLWRFGAVLEARVDRVVYLENLAFNLFLTLVFALTLRPGSEALVTRLARAVRKGNMPEGIVPYTRAVTAAWASYFVIVAAISTVFYFTQSRELWSLFVNVLVWPLTAAMFAVEYWVRLRVLRDIEHVSLLATMRAFVRRAS